jgi:hypothetical protein
MKIDSPISLDARSLALFRIGLGVYLLYDIGSRLSMGPLDIAWYTSDEPTSFLARTDTPHGAPLHQFWFYRGSSLLQYTLFGITAVLAAMFAIGFFQKTPWQALITKLPLFLLVVSYQNRNMLNHDGSDSFCRHLLFWSIFLPLADVWSVDRGLLSSSSSPRTTDSFVVTRLACLALTTQILFMYWGTVMHRTLDQFDSIAEWKHSQWMPPDLSAVHYVMNGCFARRHNALTEYLRQNATLTRSMTASAMITESFLPFLAWMGGKRRHWYGIVIASLHAGLLCTVRLPNWQWLGIVTQLVWIPTSFWGVPSETDLYKKTDGDSVSVVNAKTRPPPNPVSRFIQYFFFGYMLYNFMGMRGWIHQHDKGDIGEGVRLNQNWVMFSQVSETAENLYLTGTFTNGTEIDLWAYLSSKKDMVPHKYVLGDRETYIQDMSSRYPTARWERAFSDWARLEPIKRDRRMRHFGKALCRFVANLQQIEFRHQYLLLQPPGSKHRYKQYPRRPDTVTTVLCDPVPSVDMPEISRP